MQCRKLIQRLVVLIAVVTFSASVARAQKLSDFDPFNRNSAVSQPLSNIDQARLRLPFPFGTGQSSEGESTSRLAVQTEEIDSNGKVWSVSPYGKRYYLGRATKTVIGGNLYWVWKSHKRFINRLPAEYRTEIDPNTGRVYRSQYVGRSRQARTAVGWAPLRYAANGRAYYSYGNVSIWANKPQRRQVTQGLPGPPASPQVTVRKRIDPRSGNVFEGRFVNNRLTSERRVGQASIRLDRNGLYIWVTPGLDPVLSWPSGR